MITLDELRETNVRRYKALDRIVRSGRGAYLQTGEEPEWWPAVIDNLIDDALIGRVIYAGLIYLSATREGKAVWKYARGIYDL
jgi:hypothetical protein